MPRTTRTKPIQSRLEAEADLPSGSETILLVEDDATVRELTGRALKAQGYTLLEAQDGQAALELSNRYSDPIHLLLTDVVMPGMTGRQLAERLRPHRAEMRVLYMSGYTDDAIALRGVLAEGTMFLAKPFTEEALTQKVRAVLDSGT